MGFADKLRKELANEKNELIDTRFKSNKEEIMAILEKGIRRLGYVKTDTFNNSSTHEGKLLGIGRGEVNAFADFLKGEGFKVQKAWWGFSTDGEPDMLTITI